LQHQASTINFDKYYIISCSVAFSTAKEVAVVVLECALSINKADANSEVRLVVTLLFLLITDLIQTTVNSSILAPINLKTLEIASRR
jgi:hypothetical protein